MRHEKRLKFDEFWRGFDDFPFTSFTLIRLRPERHLLADLHQILHKPSSGKGMEVTVTVGLHQTIQNLGNTQTWGFKAGTHRPNYWMSEVFGETRTRSGTNMFGVFSCVGSFRSHSDSTCEVWGDGLSDVWAIGFSDLRCASESAWCVGGAEYYVHFGILRTPFCHFLFSYFGVLARD